MSETDGVWLTKADIARVRGITIASAYRLIRRQGWRRQPGNDGKIRVLVPSDWANGHGMGESDESDVPSAVPLTGQFAVPSPDLLTRPSDRPSDHPSDIPSDAAGFVRLIEAANVRADEANRRADVAVALADRTLAQLADAAARLEREQERADAAHQRADRAEARAAAAETAAERAQDAEQAARIATDALKAARQAEEARKGRGRLRRAWDGWRGR